MNSEIEEKEYLRETLETLRKNITDKSVQTSQNLDEIREFNKFVWDNKKQMDRIEMVTSIYDAETLSSVTNSSLQTIRNLRKALYSPYFGRITFYPENSSKPIEVYIGKTSIMDNMKFFVFDWRTPIASLFYNDVLGNASYVAPKGIINGKLSSRRQYKIENGELKRVVETGLHLDDDSLQEVLSKASSDKMRNIVSSIQEEQNRVIRNTKDKNIIVQGSAGSGKTAVALHRLAYLLYEDKFSNSNNMLIFSPNEVFSQYISNVLPELGEENVQTTTFNDFIKAYIKCFDHIETFSEFVSKYYADKTMTEEKRNSIMFKFSDEFKEALDSYVKEISKDFSFKNDIQVGDYRLRKEVLSKRLKMYNYLPIGAQLEELSKDICKSLRLQYNEVDKSLKKKLMNELYPTLNFRKIYNEFLSSNEYISRNPQGKKERLRDNHLLEYPDALGMLYLSLELLGYPKSSTIRHLVIDEAQDYSKLQIEMIKKMFNGATFTVLGDVNQTINPYFKYESLDELSQMLGTDTKYFELNKSYRSSPEITEYGNLIIGNEKSEPVRISNDLPVVFKEVPKDEIHNELVKDLLTMKENGMKRIAIITKKEDEAQAIYESLKEDIEDISVISEDGKTFSSSAIVVPSYISKGLEFDGVISYNSKDDEYSDSDKYLYYVACTRAQHNLVVYNEPESIKVKRKINN